ncbi:MAG: replication restart helicase PriA [Brevinema sp.]
MNEPWILAEVAVNVPLHDSFYYIIPKHLQDEDLRLKRVHIHFGRRQEIGFVLRIGTDEELKVDLTRFKSVKEIEEIIDKEPIFTEELLQLGRNVSAYYHAPIGEVLFTMLPPLKEPKPLSNPHLDQKKSFTPNEEQQNVFDQMKDSVGKSETVLLQGVTGSGKTEVYKLLAKECLAKGKGGIILVPEIALTDQTLRRFTEEFGTEIALFHSKLSPAERASEWFRVLKNEAKLVIGPRSAIFAPVQNLGLIILDEEHDPSYKAMDSPRYHARGVAFMRSKKENVLLVFGSATPSIESRYAAQKGTLKHLRLFSRYNSVSLPAVEIVDLRKEKAGNTFLSKPLFTKLLETLNNKKQSLIFLNRRGYSPSLLCEDCGFFFRCPNCDIGMTWHKQDRKIQCRYCEFEDVAPDTCPECGSYEIKNAGHGTEKLEESLSELLPSARILRLDLDTAKKKNGSDQILKAMRNHEADILVGTQMIAKGHDIANIDLVGVLFPEIMLSLPDFRASERTFSLIAQAIGRSGRRETQGYAVIQSYLADHSAVQCAATQDYEAFYKEEIQLREEHNYPPFSRMGRIVFRSSDTETLNQLILLVKKNLKSLKEKFKAQNMTVLGPSPCPIERINNQYRYHTIIKATTHSDILKVTKYIYQLFKEFGSHDKIKIEIDIDPTQIL